MLLKFFYFTHGQNVLKYSKLGVFSNSMYTISLLRSLKYRWKMSLCEFKEFASWKRKKNLHWYIMIYLHCTSDFKRICCPAVWQTAVWWIDLYEAQQWSELRCHLFWCFDSGANAGLPTALTVTLPLFS